MSETSLNSLCSWSGGKDSCFALITAIGQGYSPKVLLNVLNEEGIISRSHGIPSEILKAQARVMNLPIHLISSSWKDYEQKFTEALLSLKSRFNVSHAVFGDIDLEPHREWEEKVCANAGLQAILPLWKKERRAMVDEMLIKGMETIIVSCNEVMGSDFIGKKLDTHLIDELEKMGVDACGENGEYHTLVLHCELFDSPINVRLVEKLNHNGYWFSKLELQ